MDERFDRIEARLTQMEARLTALETTMSTLDARVGRLETRIGGLETELNHYRVRLDAIARDLILNRTAEAEISSLKRRLADVERQLKDLQAPAP